MAGGGAEIWVCASCRSVNKLRAKQCYNCRTPKDRAAVDPSTLDPTTHGRVREISLPDFQASRPFAMLATLLILAVASMQAASALVSSSVLLEFLDGGEPSESEIVSASLVGLATSAVGLLALIGWSAWLSMAVRTMPALGLGYPAANGLLAFVENFLPGLNLYRVPAIVRDIVRRLEPTEGRGGALIFAAWIGLLGGFFVPRIGSFMNAFASETIDGYVQNQVTVQGISTGLVLVGAIFLVVLIWWIEERIDRRRKQQLAEGVVPSAAPNALAALPAFASVVSQAEPSATSVQAPAPVPTTVPGPLGAMPAPHAPDPVLNRSISAATGAGPIPTQPPPTLLPNEDDELEEEVEPETPAARLATAAEPSPEAEPERPLPHVPSGPRLHLGVESGTSMIATLDDESEPITVEELRAAATALARADGSATITTATSLEARARAREVLEILSDAGVQATLED